MSFQENIVCSKEENQSKCYISKIEGKSCVPLSKDQERIAAAARQSALEVLSDALKKKDRVLMKTPRDLISCDSDDPISWMKRFAVLTEQRVRDLILVLEEAKFMENPFRKEVYACVYPKSRDKTIYLCPLFWEAPRHLEIDSQPGILIHEASHFLGTCDITDEVLSIYVTCNGLMMKYNSGDANSPKCFPLVNAMVNASNIQYEFEVTLRHRGDYVWGRYSCCGEPARRSVCESAVPDDFLTCPNTWSKFLGMYIDVVVMERLLPAWHRLKRHVAELRAIANTVDEVQGGSMIADAVKGSLTLGIVTAGFFLAPMAYKMLLAASLAGFATSTAHSPIGTAATNTNAAQSRINGLLGQCQAEVQLIQECTEHISMRVQAAAEDSARLSLLLPVSQVRDRAGRTVLSTAKMVRAGELLVMVGRIARSASRVLTGHMQGQRVVFVAGNSTGLHKDTRTELNKTREAVAKLEQVLCQVSNMYRMLTGSRQ